MYFYDLGDSVGQRTSDSPGGYGSIINCDDEEDCIVSSGSGEGPYNPPFIG